MIKHQVLFGALKLFEMMSQRDEAIVISFSLQTLLRLCGYWMWKLSWEHRISVCMGG